MYYNEGGRLNKLGLLFSLKKKENLEKKGNMEYSPQEQEIDLLELAKKLWNCRKLILTVCGIGAIVGMVIASGIPKEYTASIFLVPENSRRSTSSGISELSDMVGIDVNSSSTTERDAIFSLLYPDIIKSTPFLVRLFDVEVREQKDSTAIPLSQYLRERQKSPWWSVVTSAPSKLMGWGMSLFSEKLKTEETSRKTDIFRLTREEAGMAGAIASRIGIDINKNKDRRRTITLSVTMQDPLVATIVADTVLAHLKEYVTAYRTGKARRILAYNEELRKEAQAEYHTAQEKYTRYADANRGLARMASRAELARLQNEMKLALSAYNRTELQVQAAQAKVEKVIPVLAVIQPAIVPLAPSKPRKMILLLECVLLAGAGSVSWILFAKDFIRTIRQKRIDCKREKSKQMNGR